MPKSNINGSISFLKRVSWYSLTTVCKKRNILSDFEINLFALAHCSTLRGHVKPLSYNTSDIWRQKWRDFDFHKIREFNRKTQSVRCNCPYLSRFWASDSVWDRHTMIGMRAFFMRYAPTLLEVLRREVFSTPLEPVKTRLAPSCSAILRMVGPGFPDFVLTR